MKGRKEVPHRPLSPLPPSHLPLPPRRLSLPPSFTPYIAGQVSFSLCDGVCSAERCPIGAMPRRQLTDDTAFRARRAPGSTFPIRHRLPVWQAARGAGGASPGLNTFPPVH